MENAKDPSEPVAEPVAKPITEPIVLSRSERWLVLAKPVGWLSIPGRASPGAEALPVLSEWLRQKEGQVWTVHRLDRETSGVILFARNAESHRQAGIWFEKHQVKKTYLCLASGRAASPLLRLNQPIEGQRSLTQVEVREAFEDAFLARVQLQTGRRHQIRIHLAGEGHPLLGDRQYGGPTELKLRDHALPIPRVALHSSRLELPGGEVFEAPLPSDFESWLEELRR